MYTQIYESHEQPHYYATTACYSCSGSRLYVQVLAPVGSTFDNAFVAFTSFFRLKTGLQWEKRLNTRLSEIPQSDKFLSSTAAKGTKDKRKIKSEFADAVKNADNTLMAPFHYEPPAANKPRGMLLHVT
jgi:hypothetical protein